ncbi:MAG: hypothetical protein KBC18_03265 [Candidatus Saccharicenans sp.]|jgi:adenine-specific DNA methylase|nr:hypothetical protein [Candidatus Saccharicenans sp.]
MEEKAKTGKKEKVFELICPHCGARLWVDSDLQAVIQSQKGEKKKASFDDLLLKEKKKSEELGQKFESTVELRKKKLEQAEQEFKKALSHLDDLEDDKDQDGQEGKEKN